MVIHVILPVHSVRSSVRLHHVRHISLIMIAVGIQNFVFGKVPRTLFFTVTSDLVSKIIVA